MSERFRLVKETKAVTGAVFFQIERWIAEQKRWGYVIGYGDEAAAAETYRKLSAGLVPFVDTIEVLQVMPVELPS